ncbi:hypothetical protein C8J57DRAFT_1235826 [Mycena rebaudengoi]|nr:hypothetical protein C8J57DRAFT_1235826 [Mycena rebaudengoi]
MTTSLVQDLKSRPVSRGTPGYRIISAIGWINPATDDPIPLLTEPTYGAGVCGAAPTAAPCRRRRHNDEISSFGPDDGQDCFIFAFLSSDAGCVGAQNGPIRFPGISNLKTIGFNDKMSSW